MDLRHSLAVLATLLMILLLYLKHALNKSDEDVIQRWGETPTGQCFSGNAYFGHQWLCVPTQLGRFRKALGETGAQDLSSASTDCKAQSGAWGWLELNFADDYLLNVMRLKQEMSR